MNPLQVQLFTGMAAGRRARFEQSPITFGRSPENVLVIEDANVSRQHGEIRFEGGQWQLYNHSSNGTKVNRKAVKDKPRPISDGDEVYVGKQLLFSVHIEPVEASAADADAPLVPQAAQAGQPGQFGAAAQQPGAGQVNLAGHEQDAQPPKKRNKLMIGIAIYAVGLLGLVIFLSTLGNGNSKVEDNVPELTKAQIADMIRKPKTVQPVDETRYIEAINEANLYYERRDLKPGNPYRSYAAFQEAISVSGLGPNKFKDDNLQAKRRYFAVQEQLIESVSEAYAAACAKLNRGDYEGALYAFEDVQDLWRDVTSDLYENIAAKRAVASKGFGDRKLKRRD